MIRLDMDNSWKTTLIKSMVSKEDRIPLEADLGVWKVSTLPRLRMLGPLLYSTMTYSINLSEVVDKATHFFSTEGGLLGRTHVSTMRSQLAKATSIEQISHIVTSDDSLNLKCLTDKFFNIGRFLL